MPVDVNVTNVVVLESAGADSERQSSSPTDNYSAPAAGGRWAAGLPAQRANLFVLFNVKIDVVAPAQEQFAERKAREAPDSRPDAQLLSCCASAVRPQQLPLRKPTGDLCATKACARCHPAQLLFDLLHQQSSSRMQRKVITLALLLSLAAVAQAAGGQ